jgi:hypothetical protein
MAPPKGGQPNKANSNRPSSSFATTQRKYPKVFITAANHEIIQPLINNEEGEQRNNLEAEEVIHAVINNEEGEERNNLEQQRNNLEDEEVIPAAINNEEGEQINNLEAEEVILL